MEYREYEALSDEQLLERDASGDVYATETLITRYKNLVRKNAYALYLVGGDREDLLQEGMIGLYKAIRDYDKEKSAGFATFAKLCISRQMYTAIQASNTRKNQPLNDYLSFDAALPAEGADHAWDMTGEDFLPLRWYLQNAAGDPEELMIDRESERQMEERLKNRLSHFELEVLKAYLEEESYTRVAKRLGKSPKMVDNALQRIRKKLAFTA
ncbi:MAG: sigma-70 family RNA polymerase sigma factor [Lachnospiraceae bacterium]|nr:sigma-70 family RNA polymerase sigma factor [Lachnospiraceae bacterium]